MNRLNVCQFRHGKILSPICTECNGQDETVCHLLFHCKRYSILRNGFIQNLARENISFMNMSDEGKLRYVLNLDCPKTIVGLCCNYVKSVYNARESFL